MEHEARAAHRLRAAAIAVAVTVLALFAPIAAPLYADIYGPDPIPGPDASSIDEALTKANLEHRFSPAELTQYETAEFSATIVYGGEVDPDAPTVQVAWSNEAALSAAEEDAFEISPTSPSRRFLDDGARRDDGRFELTWTWDVTPLAAGSQSLTLRIVPTVVVGDQQVDGLADINAPVRFTVDVHPVQRAFDDVVASAATLETDVPDEMYVGHEYPVNARMSLAGHAGEVDVVLDLAQAPGSADVTIRRAEAAAAPPGSSPVVIAWDGRAVAEATAGDTVTGAWTVTPDEPGQVALVFTAHVNGEASTRTLDTDVPVAAATRAEPPPPSLWERIQQPVLYLAPFVALAGGVLTIGMTIRKRRAEGKAGQGSGA